MITRIESLKKRSITARYLHILIFMLIGFSAFYATLFVINRIQYINDRLAKQREDLAVNLSQLSKFTESLSLRQVRYFINYSRLLEHVYLERESQMDDILHENIIYDFIAVMDTNGKILHANNKYLGKVVSFDLPQNYVIKSRIAFSPTVMKTYRILSYPVRTKGKIVAHIIAYLDIGAMIDLRDIYLISSDSYVLNDNYINNIFVGYKNLSFIYPSEWERIKLSKAGQFMSSDAIFTYQLLPSVSEVIGYKIDSNDMYLLSVYSTMGDSAYHIDSIEAFFKYADFRDKIGYWMLGYAWIVFATFIFYAMIVNRIKNNLLANICQLTGAYNRRKGFLILESMIKECSFVSSRFWRRILVRIIFLRKPINSLHICLVDIDNLKQVNDKLGHKFGDELIATAIKSINKYLKNNEIIVRIGGDEFVIVFVNRKIIDIERVWKKIFSDYAKKNASGKYNYTIRVSKGIIEYKDGMDIELCLSEADKLMYQEKRSHKVNLYFD